MNVWNESPLPPPGGDDEPTPGPAPVDAAGDIPEPEVAEDRALFQRVAGIPAWLLLVLAVTIWVGLAAVLLLPNDDDAPRSDIAPPGAATTGATDVTTGGAAGSSPSSGADETFVVITSPPISDAATTVPIITAPATSPPATTTTSPPTSTTTTSTTTTSTTTTSTTTTSTTTTSTTAAPPQTTTPTTIQTTTPTTIPTTIPESSTVTDEAGRSLTVIPRRGECRYGPDCLVVAFTIDGFPVQPQEFVCEFSSGARYVFLFSALGVDPACSTRDVPDSIVVEVDGLRSEPITIGG